MEKIRPAAVAGRFYPGSPLELEEQVLAFLDEAAARMPSTTLAPKAVIAPHAGYVYSGPIAASAYARLAIDRASITRIVLLGPSHHVGFRGLAVPGATHFATPLGKVRVDAEAIDLVAHLAQVGVLDAAHSREHSLEVHLPFIQVALGDVAVVPFAVGDATADEVAEVIDALWGGDETRIVVSSDLSHYHGFAIAKELDADTSRAIELLRPDLIGSDRACGRTPIAGLLTVARRRGLKVRTVDLRNSGETAGPRDQVVGYGAYVVA